MTTKMTFKLDSAIKDFMDTLTGTDPYENHFTNVEEIEWRHLDGFIPFTNGGYAANIFSDLSLAFGSGSHPDCIQEFIDNDQKDALASYIDENPDTELDDNGLPADTEAYFDYETEWMNAGGVFAYQLKVYYREAGNYRNETGADEIVILAGTNTDFEYIRDSGLQTAYSECIKVSDITSEEQLESLLQDAINSI